MQVIAGSAKGRKLKSVPGQTTRPILDRVKTALFDILRPGLAGIRVLDLFAGSGSVGIEALSQGAGECTFIDVEKRAIDTIRENLKITDLAGRAEVRHLDAFLFLRKCEVEFDLVYVAPPQYVNLWVEAMHCIAERPAVVAAGGQVIVQIDPKEYEKLSLDAFEEQRQKRYGNTLLVFFGRKR